MIASTPMVPLLLSRVSKWYGNVIGVNEASISIDGGAVALLGPNGAGKSTLMKLITGQLRPSLGQVKVFGRAPAHPASRRRVGYCPDVDAFYEEMTGRQFVLSMLKLSGFAPKEAKRRANEAMETVGMNDRADKVIRGCSKGMRQRIKLAQAIAHDPDLLILDEPLSGLDPVGRRDFCDLFRQWTNAGKTILISSHVMEEVEAVAESVILVGGGRVLTQGSWKEINRFLNDIPQRFRITGDQVRQLAGRLLEWEGLVEVKLLNRNDCVVTTRDTSGLCEEMSRLICTEGFEIERFKPEGHWSETLFGMAREA